MVKATKPLNILVVEDNEGDFVLVEEFLLDEFEQLEVVHASRFSEAEKVLKSSPNTFDAVLLDLTLPDKSGESLVEEMLKIAADTPVIILTGYTDLEFSVLSLSKGISDYLLKDDLSPTLLKKSILYGIERNAFSSKIRQSEKNYRDLFELSPEPMMLFELDTYKFVDVNMVAVSQYGYSKEEFLSMTLMDIKPPEEIEESKKVIQETRDLTHVKYDKDYRHITKSGEELLVEIHASTIDYNGKNVRMALVHDVTEKRKEEERLKLLESVITNTNESVVITETKKSTNPIRRIVYVNEAFTEMTGYSKEEMIGESISILNGEETDSNEIARLYRAMDNWESFSVELINYKKNGTPFWIYISMVPVSNEKENYTHWVAIGRDITSEKKSKSQLQKSESRLQGIIDSQTNYIIRTDLEGYYTYYNPKFKEEYGWVHDKDKLEGAHCMISIKEYHHDRVRQVVEQCMKNPNEVYQVEIDKPGKSGKIKTTLWDFVCLTDNAGKPTEIQCVGIDITEKKVSETQLKESLKEKDILLAEIHHRVKNNLAVVSGMLQLQAFEEKNKDVQYKLNDSILRIQAIATIHEILYRSGSFSNLQFSDVAEQLVHKIDSVAGENRNIEINIKKTPIQLNINQAIPSALILNEILTNIFKHAYIGRDKGKIDIDISLNKEEVTIKVKDDGVGIESSGKGGGSLGLNIVKILTEQLEGEHRLYDTGNGTVFELVFNKKEVKGTGSAFV
ncbi:PAS domain S-box protein [Rhodohalobacter sp.]|uniref:PAS domain S-box protein n=1 Tax=Rhodohalobacter sp. TaxID=1974210 RepID=UPI002ACDAD9C|nr:PAS domain S-box protein [Rhodohalobacter sp.]MDZ7755425.1 PAS domain S-box protein [Rhodohalobacter sp.]